MPRSSRHRSHRLHKHSRDLSDSEEDGSPRERRIREEEPTASSGDRVSRDPELEKRRSSHEHAGKELVVTSNGDVCGEHGKKRKERAEEVAVADRWNGGEECDHKRSKCEEFGPVDLDKSSRSKLLTADSKGRSSRRHECSNERDENSGGKNDLAKHKSERGADRRESSSQYKDGRARNRIEKDSIKDREVQDSRHDKYDDKHSKKNGSKSGGATEELTSKKYTTNNERQEQYIFHSAETEELEKHLGRRDDFEDREKWLDDSGHAVDRRLYSIDDCSKNRSYKDETHEDAKYRGKYRDDDDRDQKHRDEWSEKDHTSNKSDKWNLRDENKPLESHYKRIKLQDTDRDATSYVDGHETKLKGNRGRNRYSDEKYHSDLEPRVAKEQHEVFEKNASSTSQSGSHSDKPRSEIQQSEKPNSSPRNHRLKSSISSSTNAAKDLNRNISKIAESAHGESALEDRLYPNAASKGDSSISSGLRDKISATRSGKQTLKDDIHSGELLAEVAASSKCNRNPRSDAHTSPNQSKGRSSSAIINHWFSERSPLKYERFARQCIDIEIGKRSSSSKDGDRGELALEKPIIDDISQADVCIRESTLGSSSINQSDYVSDCSLNHLPSPLPVRSGVDYPAVLDPYQDDERTRSSDRKSSNCYKRIDDLGFIRGHGNAWKGAPTWPFPDTNGFVPLQHGPPPGFHPAISPFPAPPLFGVRPPIDLTHGGVSYHMHDEAVRYSGHCEPFGWHNPVDQLSHPHMQMWDGSSDMFKDESHTHGRPEWDENSQLKSSRGWEMGSDMCKKERELFSHSLTDELAQSKCLPTGGTGGKQSSDALPVKSAVQAPQKDVIEKTHEPSNMLGDKISNCFGNYFSRIDLSPALAGSELYKRCKSQSRTLHVNDACKWPTYRSIQTNKGGSIVKMKSTSSILNSFFPSAKDIVFKRAMFLYQQQNGKAYRKHHVPAPVYSEVKRKESPQASANQKVQGGAKCASLGKTDADSTDHIKAGDITVIRDSDCPGDAKDQKSDFHCDPTVHGNSTQGCEVIAEECRMNVSQIHNAPENTH
ncbi:hypothetical protein MUK42_17080 [Musa troglodytarum]|uniref:Uncharacterized protein n=1 Tax=Musa troglodytarum TaxID=320322 RepID=A0A9E7HTK8_9LILI|nr:hypothetical protein MUK42_17080 [Musa troglodytarum]